MYLNFDQDGTLWEFQQSLFNKIQSGQKVTDDEIDRLKGNLYTKIAKYLAPSNLVIRQQVLLNILVCCDNESAILRQIDLLTYKWVNGKLNLWAEGYSYWSNEVKSALLAWIESYKQYPLSDPPKLPIMDIDELFQASAYNRDGILYPAPFGDVYNSPLDPTLQNQSTTQTFSPVLPISIQNNKIHVCGKYPIGLNLHTPDKTTNITITDGSPTPFTWYTGFANKYKTALKEIFAMCKMNRMVSVLRMLLWKS
jgi:hypothetical protein